MKRERDDTATAAPERKRAARDCAGPRRRLRVLVSRETRRARADRERLPRIRTKK
jgi:hypothetical protein